MVICLPCFIYIKRRYGPIFLEGTCTTGLIIEKLASLTFFHTKSLLKKMVITPLWTGFFFM
ncbi:hypothetical protein NST14_04995 [Bacillus sp. FSL W8-0519]|uniref:hypothetical protein n=1 Tax=Bacillus sp. FSL W8-0519 TaxID=2954624 RepID=UPI0030F4DD96